LGVTETGPQTVEETVMRPKRNDHDSAHLERRTLGGAMVTAGLFVAPIVALSYPVATVVAIVVACIAFWGGRQWSHQFDWHMERPSRREGEP